MSFGGSTGDTVVLSDGGEEPERPRSAIAVNGTTPPTQLGDFDCVLTETCANDLSSLGSTQPQQKTFTIGCVSFEVDTRYVPKGKASGFKHMCCYAANTQTGQMTVIQKVEFRSGDVFNGIMALRDIQIRRHLAHENILSVQDLLLPSSSSTFDHVYVVQESMDTDLRALIRSQNSLSDDVIKYFMYNILSGLQRLHAANLMHRTLRPDKILVNRNDEVKISGFEHTCQREEIRVWIQRREEYKETCVRNIWYDAPEEHLAPGSLDTSVDIWAAGCILAELIRRKPVFPARDYTEQLKMVFKLIGNPDDDEVSACACPTQLAAFMKSHRFPKLDLETVFPTANPLALDLLERMLCFDPKKRITAEGALMHQYFSEYNIPEIGNDLECEVLPTMECTSGCKLACLDLDESNLREEFLNEMEVYHPEYKRLTRIGEL